MIARLVVALVVLSGCGRILGIHDFSAADGSVTEDPRAQDALRSAEIVDLRGGGEAGTDANREESGMKADGAIDRTADALAGLDTAPADTAPPIDGPESDAHRNDTKSADSQDTAPESKPCPALTWQWATTSILANPGKGACSYDPATLPTLVAAVDNQGFDQARACGTCLRLIPGRPDAITTYVDVLVVDTAGTSDTNRQLSISRQAMDVIAAPGTQSVGLNFAFVSCPTALIGSTIRVTRQQGSTPQHMGIQIRNQALPLRTVEIWFAGTWNGMTFAPYNYWIFDSVGVSPPYSLRMTNSLGDTLTAKDLVLTSTGTADGPFVDTNVQFPSCAP